VREASTPVCGHDDQVGVLVGGVGDDLVYRVPGEDLGVDRTVVKDFVEVELLQRPPRIGAAMLIVLIATIYPATRASAMKPVDALRYE